MTRRSRRTDLASALGFLLALLLWEWAARATSGLAVAAPLDTLHALAGLCFEPGFLRRHLAISLMRTAGGLGIGIGSGLALGTLAGSWPPLRRVFAPFRWALTSIPGVVVVMLAMLWLGLGSAMVTAIVALMSAPTVYVAVLEGLSAVDADLLEMASLYRLPTRLRLGTLYLRALAAPLLSAAVLALGGAMRVVVLAEALGAGEGLGHLLSVARANLDTPRLYALALLSMAVVGLAELTLIGPARRLAWRWRA
jgi:NitT/TauT family transport system permease protein